MLTDRLEEPLYTDIVRLMNVFDIQIIVYSLEALYQLSELGEHTTTKIAAVKHAVGKYTETTKLAESLFLFVC